MKLSIEIQWIFFLLGFCFLSYLPDWLIGLKFNHTKLGFIIVIPSIQAIQHFRYTLCTCAIDIMNSYNYFILLSWKVNNFFFQTICGFVVELLRNNSHYYFFNTCNLCTLQIVITTFIAIHVAICVGSIIFIYFCNKTMRSIVWT